MLEHFKDAIEAFASQHLDNYVQARRRDEIVNPKEFNDPVWGTIVARPHEVVVIDSPLFQRLQEIRQLGVAHLVFRSANHTRFEHSLGTLHAMSVLIRETNETVKDTLRHDAETATLFGPPISEELEDHLRLAALLHDVGHGFMSHVSEKAFRGTDWLLNLQEAIESVDDRIPDDPHVSELAAYFIVRSKAFGELLDFLCRNYNLQQPNKIMEAVSNAILGIPVDDRRPFVTELLSGPIDVDKLDYISRDAYMCGVPSVIDINRLIRKLRTTISRRDQLPQAVAERLATNVDHYLVTGIARSGACTLDEFALARSLLTDKVYRHQKVRAYEALIASIFRILSELSSEALPIAWALTDVDLLALPIAELARRSNIVNTSATARRKLRLLEVLRAMFREKARLRSVLHLDWRRDRRRDS